MMADDQVASDAVKFLRPGICRVPNCEAEILLDDQSRLYACKHRLISLSEYFEKLFMGEFKEKNNSDVKIHGVVQSSMLVFLDWATVSSRPFQKWCDPTPFDDAALNSMIFLADRFMCERLEQDILYQLNTDEMFKKPPEAKLELLITADKYRGSSTAVLEACIKLCANLDLEKVAEVHGKIANGTLAAVYAMVAKTMSEVLPGVGSLKFLCSGTNHACKKIEAGKIYCASCAGNIVKEMPIDLKSLKEIESDKSLL